MKLKLSNEQWKNFKSRIRPWTFAFVVGRPSCAYEMVDVQRIKKITFIMLKLKQ